MPPMYKNLKVLDVHGHVSSPPEYFAYAAGIMAGLTWQLNYSRVAFPTMYSMTLDALAAAFFALGLKRRSAVAFAAASLKRA